MAFIDDAEKDRFETLALAIFAHQFEHCAPYREYCRSRGKTPQSVTAWADIPPVPVIAFKHAELCCAPPVRIFLSSGTTEGADRRSQHRIPDLRLYQRAAVTGLRRFLFPDVTQMRLLSLIHRVDDLPSSSLTQMVGWAMEMFGAARSRYAIGPQGIDVEAFVGVLREAERGGEPVCVLATTGALLRVLDDCRTRGLAFRLPHGSRLMDTGGDKGAPRHLSRNGILHAVWTAFAIPGYFCINEYGMAELSSQYYDSVIADRVHGRHRARRKLGPHWMRTRLLDPDTLLPVAPGGRGLLCHFDLANAGSVMAVLSEDIGQFADDGFQLVGRAAGAELRGCSLSAAGPLPAELRGAPGLSD